MKLWWDRDKTPKADVAASEQNTEDAVLLPPGMSTDDAPPVENRAEGNEKMSDNANTPPVGASQGDPALTITAAQSILLTAVLGAGIDTAEKFSALKANAEKYVGLVDAARTEAKARATTLYADEPKVLEAELAIIDALPAGAALDHHLSKLNASYDAQYETTADGPAKRKSAPNALANAPRVAGDAAGSTPNVEPPSKEESQKAQGEYQSAY